MDEKIILRYTFRIPLLHIHGALLPSMWHTLRTKEESDYVKPVRIHPLVFPRIKKGPGARGCSDAARIKRHYRHLHHPHQ